MQLGANIASGEAQWNLQLKNPLANISVPITIKIYLRNIHVKLPSLNVQNKLI